MSNEPQISIGRSEPERVERTTQLAAKCFIDDPEFVYWLNSRPREWRVGFHPQLMRTVIRCAALCDNYFLEANDWQSYLVLTQPGVDPESTPVGIRAGWLGCFWAIGFSGFKRIQHDYIEMFKTARKRHIGTVPHYYIFSCGTDERQRREGLMATLLVESTKIAQSTGDPIWSEATTAGSCAAHMKAGFEMVGEIILGEGLCDKTGEAKQGGQGVKMFALVWRPKTSDPA